MSVWTSAVLPLVKINPLNHIVTLGFLIFKMILMPIIKTKKKDGLFHLCGNTKHIIFWAFPLNVSWRFARLFSNHKQAVMTHLREKTLVLEKPYRTTAGTRQRLTSGQLPVGAFTHEPPDGSVSVQRLDEGKQPYGNIPLIPHTYMQLEAKALLVWDNVTLHRQNVTVVMNWRLQTRSSNVIIPDTFWWTKPAQKYLLWSQLPVCPFEQRNNLCGLNTLWKSSCMD